MPGTRYLKLAKTTIDLILTFFGNRVCFTSCFHLATAVALVAGFWLAISHPQTIYADDPFFSENFNDFAGAGFSPDPSSGQLDSDVWIVTKLSDGDVAFGEYQASGDFARGKSDGGVGTGGIYAFEREAEDNILGVQPGDSDFTPGEIILRLQNSTGITITQLNVGYDIWYYNDQDRANSLNFSYSTGPTFSDYTALPDLDFTTPAAADGNPFWQSETRSTTLTTLELLDGEFIYLRWLSDDAGGSGSRDEYGIDNVQITIPTESTPTPTTAPTPTATVTVTPIPTFTITATITPTATAKPTDTATPTPTAIFAAPGDVVINEIVTDPQQDWSSNDFNGTPGTGSVSDTDEFIELYIKTGGLDLTGWTIELLDGSDVSGDLTPAGAFQVTNYLGTGTFTNTVAGDFLVLGNVAGSARMNDDILIVLKDNTDTVIDKVEVGSDPEIDGPTDGAPDGTTNGGNATGLTDEAIFRFPNGVDTDNDIDDFLVGMVTLGINNEPGLPPPPPPPDRLLISEFLYDGLTPSSEGDEFVELCNPNSFHVSLPGYQVGDDGLYKFPADAGDLAPNTCVVIAKNADEFQTRFGSPPDYEFAAGNDNPSVSNLEKVRGGWTLSNTGDEIVVCGPSVKCDSVDHFLDSVAYRHGDYAGLGLEPEASAPEPLSLQRVWPTDTNSMTHDFVRTEPNPGWPTAPPPPPATVPPPAELPGGMKAYWGHLHAHTTYSDGAGPPFYALAMARAAGLHFYSISDHSWWLNDWEWERTLSQVTNATVAGQFVALRGQEWSHDTVGHVNLFNTDYLVQRTDPRFDTLPELYGWLAANPAVIAQFNHPDPSYDGNFENFAFDAQAAPQLFLQEIGNHAQGYVTYEPAFVQSNAAGYKVAPTNNGDTHTTNWGTDTIGHTGIVAPALTEVDLLAALRARRVFATEDRHLALTLRSHDTWMGSTLPPTESLSLTVDVVASDPEPATLYLYDGNLIVATVPLADSTGQWSTTVAARPGHFFWAKLVQADGQRAYSAPLWIEGRLEPEAIVLNEILPAPLDNWDWDGNGTADFQDEYIELYNPLDRPVGLGGWRLVDESGRAYDIPLNIAIPARGFSTFFATQTGFSLNNGGETVSLFHPNGALIDSFSYEHSPGYDESWCRLADGEDTWSDDCGPSPYEPNWEKSAPGPLTANIYQVKRLTRNAWVKVKGYVTAPPGLLGARTMYIQDGSAGIMVYLPKDHRLELQVGEKVEVKGHLRNFHEEWEISVSRRGDVKSKGLGEPPPPLPVATTSLLEPYEGMLVMLRGQAVNFKGRTTFWVDDGTGPAKIYLRSGTGIKKPFIEPGTPVTVVGIVSQYSDKDNPTRNDYRLLPRFPTDLILPESGSPPVPSNWPTMLPDTGY